MRYMLTLLALTLSGCLYAAPAPEPCPDPVATTKLAEIQAWDTAREECNTVPDEDYPGCMLRNYTDPH